VSRRSRTYSGGGCGSCQGELRPSALRWSYRFPRPRPRPRCRRLGLSGCWGQFSRPGSLSRMGARGAGRTEAPRPVRSAHRKTRMPYTGTRRAAYADGGDVTGQKRTFGV
jgi:hypothetical protein